MKPVYENAKERTDSEILFSKSVKAGKRIYYIDVKRDRHEEFYLSITESKRVKDGTEEERPVFEKHKIFLYREDLEKFMEAMGEAVGFACENSPEPQRRRYNRNEEVQGESVETTPAENDDIKLDIDF
jgi:hypothetical protein